MTDPRVDRVHVVAKTHLDLGFTGLAEEVVECYLDEFFPTAMATAEQLRSSGAPLGLTWTTGSWILREALERRGDETSRAALAAAVERGDLAWHSMPLTFHTELLDVDLLRHGLSISAGLDRRFGRRGLAAKMTDVPGHTRSMVPLLAEAGIGFLHLGVNPAWPVPDVPPVFRWRAPDGSEVVVAYQAGGYGGDVVVDGCSEVLSFLHAGDNLGPPSVDDVMDAYQALIERYPGAEIVASTMDAFAEALLACPAADQLPVVTAEIGDSWIFGAGSDPEKVAEYRQLLRCRRTALLDPASRREVDDALLLVAEHTWGLDEKIAVPDPDGWDRAWLDRFRSGGGGRRYESSWAEQRSYVGAARAAMERGGISPEPRPTFEQIFAADDSPPPPEHGTGQRIDLGGWEVSVDAEGSIDHLVHPSGRVIADADHRLGRVVYRSFDEGDYAAFLADLTITPEDAWWAERDNSKPGIDASGAVSERSSPDRVTVRADPRSATLLVEGRFADPAEPGVPEVVRYRWEFGSDRVSLSMGWPSKEPSRLPEALWIDWNPVVGEPDRWTMDKLGMDISPVEVVRHGGRRLHAVGEGMRHRGGDRDVQILTLDAPLVAPGGPALLDADPTLPDMSRGFSVLLFDNCWGTNFPMWIEGSALFRFEMAIRGLDDREPFGGPG